jgi:hypothetical protein
VVLGARWRQQGAGWNPFMAALRFFPATTEENDEGDSEFDGRQRKWYIAVTCLLMLYISHDKSFNGRSL